VATSTTSEKEVGALSPIRFMARIMIIVFGVEVTIMVGFMLLPPLNTYLETLVDSVALTIGAGTIAWFAIGRPFRRSLAHREMAVARAQEEMVAQGRSRDLDAQIMRALDMADTEVEVLEVARHTLTTAVPGHPGEILLADSSHAHLRVAAGMDDDAEPICSVDSPSGCPAVRRGHPLAFTSSLDIDACPRLRNRPTGDVSAVCVPVAVLGRAAGVLHVTSTPGKVPDPATVERLRLLGGGIGSRLGMIRSLDDSALAAGTDPLTGLLNRRSLEARTAPLERASRSYSVIAMDLDHFKMLNDTHGHLTGDQALRLFARVLRSTCREGDFAARMGGEEFLVLLPDTRAVEAVNLSERVRLELAHALTSGGVPGFTVSAGVADSSDGSTFEEVLNVADGRLYQAKQAGRDRVQA
jgi:diguanylate cyclase (GGDEF)-like protein